jgi:hypothetical protein
VPDKHHDTSAASISKFHQRHPRQYHVHKHNTLHLIHRLAPTHTTRHAIIPGKLCPSSQPPLQRNPVHHDLLFPPPRLPMSWRRYLRPPMSSYNACHLSPNKASAGRGGVRATDDGMQSALSFDGAEKERRRRRRGRWRSRRVLGNST